VASALPVIDATSDSFKNGFLINSFAGAISTRRFLTATLS